MDLPIFLAQIENEEDGLFVMSLVSMPATEKDWLCYNSNKEIQKFAVQDEEEHILCGVVMLADTPIYRRDAEGREYYIKYSKETLKVMAEKMLFDNTANNIDMQHDGKLLPKGMVSLRELFIKDVEKGINPVGFEDVADGSLLCTYKVNDNDLWELCKNGEFNGFSLEGMFSITKEVFQKVENNNKNFKTHMSKFKELIADLIMKFGSIDTDKGTLIYEGEELAVGASVNGVSGQTVEDGEYTYEDKVITVKDGKVEAISDKEEEVVEETTEETVVETMEEATEETPTEEETVEETVEEATEETPNEVEQLKAEIEVLKSEIEAIKNQLAEIVAAPSVEPIAEQYEKVTEQPKGANLGVFAYLKK